MTSESGEKRKRGSASRDPTPDANAADPSSTTAPAAAAALPVPPLHPRPIAPPRPLGTEEDLSHGQRPASDAARADRGVPAVAAGAAEAHAAAAAAAPPPTSTAAKLLVPGHSAWFRYYAVHRLEREALPEWFDGRHGEGASASTSNNSKTPEGYMRLRNLLVDVYRENPLRRLTYTEARARAAAAAAAAASSGGGEPGSNGNDAAGFDAVSVLRLHSFLDHWGILNFQAPPPSAAGEAAAGGEFGGRGYYSQQGKGEQQQLAGPPAALLTRVAGGISKKKKRPLPPGTEAVFSFPPASVAAGVAAAGGTGVPPGLAALAGRKDRYGRSLAGEAVPATAAAAGQQQQQQQGLRIPRYFCSAMPWVECTAARYHCTRLPDVDLSPAAFADGRFPPGCSAKDFVRIDGGAPAPLPGAEAAGASAAAGSATDAPAAPPIIDPGTRPAPQTAASAGDWTDAETLALLEGIELYGSEDWAEVAAHVGSRSAFACVRRFLALPLADEFLAELEAPARAAGVAVVAAKEQGEKEAEDEEEIPFADAGNPVMAQVAFLSHMVGPRVAAAAAARALEVLTEEEDDERGEKKDANGDGGGEMTSKKMRAAAAAGLAAAAVKARLLADAEEREVVRLASAAAAALSARIEAKVALLDGLERALDGERSAAEAARDAAFAERRAMAVARVEEGAAHAPLPPQ